MEDRPRIPHIPNPCMPDCPYRSGTCHADCKAYADYAAARRQIYAVRIDESDATGFARERQLRKKRYYNN